MTQLLLLNDDGSIKCRKPLPSLVDQSMIKGDGETTKFTLDLEVVSDAMAGSGLRENAGQLEADLVVSAPLSGKGRTGDPLQISDATPTAKGIVELTGTAQIPADLTDNDNALTPAAAVELLGYIKPVGVTGALNAEQTSANAIEVPMFSNVSCTGGTGGSPKFSIPMEGGGECVVDVGAWGGGNATLTPGANVVSCGAATMRQFATSPIAVLVAARGTYTTKSRFSLQMQIGVGTVVLNGTYHVAGVTASWTGYGYGGNVSCTATLSVSGYDGHLYLTVYPSEGGYGDACVSVNYLGE